jgi:hypothetical protein
MSTKGYPAPLTWDRLLELAAQGHDHYDAALTSTRARQLVASVREHFLQTETEQALELMRASRADWEQTARDLNVTLERVRAEVDKWSGSGCEDGDTPAFCAMVGIAAALASQTEASKVCTECEAPIGTERHFCEPADFHQTVRDALARELVAVKARIAELETQHDADIDAIARAVRHENAANARADAAERERKVLEEIEGMKSRLSLSVGCSSHYPHDLSEQGCEACQLKSQLAQVEIEAEVSLAVTNHERKVLTAMGEIQIERSSFGNLYMVPKGLQPLLEAELANRAAKAKK